jgi:hypothetical protein
MKINYLKFLSFLIIFNCCSSTSSKLISTVQSPKDKSLLLITPIVSIEILKNKCEVENKAEIESLNQEIGANVYQITDSFFMRKRLKLDKYQYNEIDDMMPINEILEYLKKLTTSKRGYSASYSKYTLKKMLNSIKISEDLCNYIKEKDNRFALSIITTGFSRTLSNNKSRKVDNVAKTLIFGAGAYGPTSGFWHVNSENLVQTYFFLIDAEKQQLVMFQKKEGLFDPKSKNELQGLINVGLSEYWQ